MTLANLNRVDLFFAIFLDITSIWDLVSQYVVLQMRSKKGVYISNLGTFSFTSIKLDIGNNKHVLTQRPVFLVSEKFAQLHRLEYTKYHTPGEFLINITIIQQLLLHSPNRWCQETANRPLGLQVKLPACLPQASHFWFYC